MSKLVICTLLMGLAVTAEAYVIKHSYSGQNNSVEFYGACNDGEMLKVTKHADGRFTYEGPAGGGTIQGRGGLDKAAAAACGE